ncbi:hypothetical protein AGIG_G21511 [Arapaima gigas]
MLQLHGKEIKSAKRTGSMSERRFTPGSEFGLVAFAVSAEQVAVRPEPAVTVRRPDLSRLAAGARRSALAARAPRHFVRSQPRLVLDRIPLPCAWRRLAAAGRLADGATSPTGVAGGTVRGEEAAGGRSDAARSPRDSPGGVLQHRTDGGSLAPT